MKKGNLDRRDMKNMKGKVLDAESSVTSCALRDRKDAKSSVASCSLREPGQRVVRATKAAKASRECGDQRAPRPGHSCRGAGYPVAETAVVSEEACVSEPAAGPAAATRTRKKPEARVLPRGEDFNPLLALEEERRSRLFVYMRECPYRDSVPEVSDAQLEEFFGEEAHHHWEVRTANRGERGGTPRGGASRGGADDPGLPGIYLQDGIGHIGRMGLIGRIGQII